MTKRYEISAEDIGSMVNYLKVFDPSNANDDFAAAFLSYLKDTYRQLSIDDEPQLTNLLLEFKNSSKN